MAKRWQGILATAAAGACVLVVPSGRADAGSVVSATDTELAIALTGDAAPVLACTAGSVTVDGAPSSPAIACTALTRVVVTGDAGAQAIDGRPLTAAAFPSLPALAVDLGGGDDIVWEGAGADEISTGAGADELHLFADQLANGTIDLGANPASYDRIVLHGTAQDDTMSAVSTGPQVTVSATVGSARSTDASGVEWVELLGGDGDDTLSFAGVTTATSLQLLVARGEGGDDTLTAGSEAAQLRGGPGSNVLTGGTGADRIYSESQTDVIAAGGGANLIRDTGSRRSGGRTVSGNGYWMLDVHPGDNVTRIRPRASGGNLVTTSLTRPGQQVLPSTLRVNVFLAQNDAEPDDHGMVDVVVGGQAIYIDADEQQNDLIDVTVPSGTWTQGWVDELVWGIRPSDPKLAGIDVHSPGPISVHGPWTDGERSFVHRATRDLLFRFPTAKELDDGDALVGAGLSRAEYARSLMSRIEYDSLDVDRTFIRYLRRQPDAKGQTYWITSLHNGKALWRFRAQLFGSNEYFTKAGGTNESYVVKAYNDVLGRDPDPSGRAYWTNKLNAGADRGQVALQFMNSPEARRRLVDDQFLRFVDRLPSAEEQARWVAALPSATGERDLIRTLVGGIEYANRT